MQSSPPPFVFAAPDEKNILTCEYRVCCLSVVPRRWSDPKCGASNELVGNYIIVSILAGGSSRTHQELTAISSADLRTVHTQAESTMVNFSSPLNTHLNRQASRQASLPPRNPPQHSRLTSLYPNCVSIQMLTPSGRFQPDKKICFSMSDFHPGTVRYDRSTCTDCLLHYLN